MNRLFFNYPAQVTEIVDSKRFRCDHDFGMRRIERVVHLLRRADWPVRGDIADAAQKCLRMCLMYEEATPTGTVWKGRRIGIATERPSDRNSTAVSAYVLRASPDMLLPNVVWPTIAAIPLLNVNSFMVWMMEHRFDVEEARMHIDTLDLQPDILQNAVIQNGTTHHVANAG